MPLAGSLKIKCGEGDVGLFKEPRIEIPGHLAFIRKLPCLISGQHGVEAAHVRYPCRAFGKRQTGKAEKPHDFWVVPLSSHWHRKQHNHGDEVVWWMNHVNIDPIPIAITLFAYYSIKNKSLDERLEMATKVCTAATNGLHPFAGDEPSW